MELNLKEIFTDYGSAGFSETWREFQGYFIKQFFPLVKTQIERLYFGRFDYPLLVFPILALGIIALIAFWKKPTYSGALLAAAPTGILFYSYFHYWVYWIIVLGLLSAYTIIFEKQDKKRQKCFVFLLILSILAALPYLLNYFDFSKIESAHDYSLRLGIAEGREPGLYALGFDYLIFLAMAIIIYRLYWTKERLKAALLLNFLMAAAIVWNIQLITGFVPAPNNWKRTISPFLFIIIFLIVHDLIKKYIKNNLRLKKNIGLVVILLTLLVVSKKITNAAMLLYNPETRILKSYSFPSNITDSWHWMNLNLKNEPTILSNSFLTSLYLNSYTSARPFLPVGNLTTQTTAKLEDRFLRSNKLLGVSAETIMAQLKNSLPIECNVYCPPNTEQNLGKNLWHLYFHYFRGGPINNYMARPQTITDGYIKNLLGRYGEISNNFKN
ncbi:MAG: hypothetical protein HYV54_00445, partial [Parcubacteria group bacterium]|nr:hypothetical protein [Parcubacteria group bacterium]